MINFIEYVGREVNFRKGLKFRVDELPSSVLREIEAGRKVGIWWFQSAEESTYKVVARTVFDRYHLAAPDGRNEYAYMDVDPSESYTCLSSLGDKVSVRMPELVLAGQRFHQIDDATHSLISRSVRNSTKSTLSRTKGNVPNREPVKVDDTLIAKTRDVFARIFERHVNEAFYQRREDSRDRISGPGIAVLDSLIRDHQVEPTKAYDIVVALDPICRDIVHESVSPSPDPDTLPPEQVKPPEVENILPEPYVELTDEAMAARTYSDPLSFHEGMAATQRAEDVHQAMLRSITQCLRDRGGYRILFNKFADLALNTVANDTPCHIIEIKSITPANIESQISKGLIQLSRLQFMHRGSNVKFHLVAEGISVPPPSYLKSLADRLGVSLHRFDQGLPGQNACQTLYAKLYNSNGSA
jgi:hypothetical protein